MQKIIIIGNGISAEILYKYLSSDERYQVHAFAADGEYIQEKQKLGLPVEDLDTLTKAYSPKEYDVLLAVGYKKINGIRQEMYHKVKSLGYKVVTYIHPSANIFNDFDIGEGSVILPGTTVEPFVKIGINTVVWANCVIGHHAEVGDNCWVASGTVIAGQAKIGNNSFLGVNVTVSNQVSVGAFNIIGGNTAIHKNTKENEVFLSAQGEKHRFSASDYDTFFLK